MGSCTLACVLRQPAVRQALQAAWPPLAPFDRLLQRVAAWSVLSRLGLGALAAFLGDTPLVVSGAYGACWLSW